MCGIGGWIGRLPQPEQAARAMAGSLRLRGPDSSDWRLWDGAGLVHTRLSIIDLSAAAREPMPSEDGSIWSVFNGEIYNHHALRRTLESQGHVFRSHTDAEVIPHLYEQHGPDFVRLLRGMFAIAIFDTREGRLVLTRDRFGIKPLYFAQCASDAGPVVAFASEIRTLRELPGVDTTPVAQSLSDFLAFSYVPPPATFYSGIASVEPGELIEVSIHNGQTRLDKKRHHTWEIAPRLDLTLEEAVAEAQPLLAHAVGSQIESDVPLGSMLSGGIDSSLVSALAQPALHGSLSTFSVQFPEPEYDETAAALTVAGHIDSRHSVLPMVDADLTWDRIQSLLATVGQPFGDTSIFAANALSALMRRHITVALSGDGGDEGFGGYASFGRMADAARFANLPRSLQPVIARGLRLANSAGLASKTSAEAAANLAGRGDAAMMTYLLSWIRDEERERLLADVNVLPPERLFERVWDHHLPAQASRLERLSALQTEVRTRLILAGDLLPKVDSASMHEGLEVRVPLLDEDLFAFALTLPHKLKSIAGETKPVLRRSAAKVLPVEVTELPKHGFGVPVDTILPPSFKQRLYETLTASDSGLDGLLDPGSYHAILEAFCFGRPLPGVRRDGLYQRAMMLLSLHVSVRPRVPSTAG